MNSLRDAIQSPPVPADPWTLTSTPPAFVDEDDEKSQTERIKAIRSMLQRHPLDTPEALLGRERWEHPLWTFPLFSMLMILRFPRADARPQLKSSLGIVLQRLFL